METEIRGLCLESLVLLYKGLDQSRGCMRDDTHERACARATNVEADICLLAGADKVMYKELYDEKRGYLLLQIRGEEAAYATPKSEKRARCVSPRKQQKEEAGGELHLPSMLSVSAQFPFLFAYIKYVAMPNEPLFRQFHDEIDALKLHGVRLEDIAQLKATERNCIKEYRKMGGLIYQGTYSSEEMRRIGRIAADKFIMNYDPVTL